MMSAAPKKKNVNIELVRIISMLMIISVHGMNKGGLLDMQNGGLLTLTHPTTNSVVAWIMECANVNGLNLFMLITGYLLCKSRFKAGRLFEIICQVMFYSLGILAVLLAVGERYDTYHYLRCIFPVHNNIYWFCTAYVLLYLLSPVLVAGIKKMSKGQLKLTIFGLLAFEMFFKTVMPVRFTEDESGYNLIWFLVMFLIAAYIRLYDIEWLKKPLKAYLIHLACVALMFAEQFALSQVNLRTGRFEDLLGVSLEHNHIFLLLSSVSLFMAIINAREIQGVWAKLITFAAPLSFGVYLFHEHDLIRYEWPKWIGVSNLASCNVIVFVLGVLGYSVAIYIIGGLVDYLRSLLFKLIKKLFANSKAVAFMKKIDSNIAEGVQGNE